IFGNLYLADKHGGFTEEDAALVESLAIIAGSAVATARLHERLGRLALVEERERIARELHDAVIGDLFGVGLSLQASAGEVSADPEGVRDRLAEAVDRLDEAIATLRRYIFDVGRPLAGRRDLEGRLRELIEDLVGPWEVDVAVSVTGVTTDAPDDLASDLLQFVREGVANALRHSGAHHIDIHLRRDGERFIIEVKDDGSGFDPDSVTRGMGLENLRRRARHAGGDTELRSSPGQGTTVKGVFPFTGS
ncbi:MAG: sensor histidine kinase, partial [Acidimicrobiia bacterium]